MHEVSPVLVTSASQREGGSRGALPPWQASSISRCDTGTGKTKLLAMQRKCAGLLSILVDEFSMIGQKLMGHSCLAFDEFLNEGKYSEPGSKVPLFGAAAIVMLFGDPKQLPPVLDAALTAAVADSPIARAGYAAWQQMQQYHELSQPVRQDSKDEFFRQLERIRNGVRTRSSNSFAFWQQRVKLNVVNKTGLNAYEEEWGIDNADTLFASTTNAQVRDTNTQFVMKQENVCVMKANCCGTHSHNSANLKPHAKAGMLGSIPVTAYYFIGQMVKLTMNLIPELKLFNGSRGTVRDIIYPNGNGYQSEETPIIVIEFPDYIGPPVNEKMVGTRRKWVPIASTRLSCDCKKCSREGVPVVCGKADTMHKLQGTTIGRGQSIKKLVITGWKIEDEAKWPGILYVALSRVKKVTDLVLDVMINKTALASLDANEGWQRQHKAYLAMQEKARLYRQNKVGT
jgi:hypothetical protein